MGQNIKHPLKSDSWHLQNKNRKYNTLDKILSKSTHIIKAPLRFGARKAVHYKSNVYIFLWTANEGYASQVFPLHVIISKQ